MASVETLTSIARRNAVGTVLQAKASSFDFLDYMNFAQNAGSETKRKQFSSSDQKVISGFLNSALNSKEGTNSEITFNHGKEAPSFIKGAKVLEEISSGSKEEILEIFAEQTRDLDTRFPVSKTADGQSYITLALQTLALSPGEENQSISDIDEMQGAARIYLTKLMIKDPAKAANSGLSVSYRANARKILLADNQADFLNGITSFARTARVENKNIKSADFKSRLTVELGGGISGAILAEQVIARVDQLLKTDYSRLVEEITEKDPKSVDLPKIYREFQTEQVEQFKAGVVRGSFDRETAPKGNFKDEAAAIMQDALNKKIAAWEGIVQASYSDNSDGVDEITALMEAYNQGIAYQHKQESLLEGTKKNLDDGIAKQLDAIQNHNRAANRNKISQPITIKKEFLTGEAKKAVLVRLVDKIYESKDSAQANGVVLSADDIANKITALSKSSTDNNNFTFTRNNGSQITIQKADLQKIIDGDPSSISVDYKNGSGASRTITMPARRLLSYMSADLQANEDEILAETLKRQDKAIDSLRKFMPPSSPTDARNTKALISALDESQLNQIFDDMGTFTIELQPEDQNAMPGAQSFAKMLETTYREKHKEIKALVAYTRKMNAKADAIMAKTLEKNPAVLNKLVQLYKDQTDEFALVEMLAAHNLRDIAFGVSKDYILGSSDSELLVDNSLVIAQSEANKSLERILGNTEFNINGNNQIDSALWSDFFGDGVNAPDPTSDLMQILDDSERETIMNTYKQRIELAENNPLSRKYITEIAKKELFFEGVRRIKSKANVGPAIKAKYDAITLPDSDAVKNHDSQFQPITEYLTNYMHDAKRQAEFVELVAKGEINEDNFSDNALIYDRFDPLDKAQSESMTPIIARLREILSPILQVFFRVNANDDTMQEAFKQSLEHDSQDSLSIRVHSAMTQITAEALGDSNKTKFLPEG